MTLLRTGLLLAVVVALVAAPYTRRHMFGPEGLSGFAAFYCGGDVMRRGLDPYRAEPLRACERALPSYRYDAAGVVEPAPFPPVVLVAFGMLAALPFAWAVGLYAALAIAAIAFAGWALQRMTGFSPYFVGASLAVGALYQNLRFGELPPLVIGIVCGAALLLERGRPRAAALVAALSLIEPHVAGPVLLALFVAVKPARAPLAVLGLILAVMSVAVFDPRLTAEYFGLALPAHAASEIPANDQFSVTWIAHQLRVGDVAALRAGALSYVLMTVLGILAGLRLAQRFARPAFIVLVPAAFAVIGGTFIHDLQLPIAIPAALLLAGMASGRTRVLALGAGMLLAVMWFDDFSAVLGLGVVAMLAWTIPFDWEKSAHRTVLTACLCVAYAGTILVFHGLSSDIHRVLSPHPNVGGPPQELASAVWGRFVRMTDYGWPSIRTIAEKLPLWTALVLLLCAAWRAARPPSDVNRLRSPVDKRVVVQLGGVDRKLLP